ncbi:MAG: NAD+ synthase [Gammaproteobacteria bacterium]|nr:NAD+ synthase [Gammaproteobacteria bacterium]
MSHALTISIAQLNFHVGDISGNAQKVIEAAKHAYDKDRADLVVFPELTLTSYPPEDLLLRPSLQKRIDGALDKICKAVQGVDVLLGSPYFMDGKLYNCAILIQSGAITAIYQKQHLPNYQVFDEVRYFTPGSQSQVVMVKGIPVGITICEDIWFEAPARQAVEMGAKLIVNLNASPFHIHKQEDREKTLKARVAESGVPIVYANLVGGQDELVFDGRSMLVDSQGGIRFTAPACEEGIFPLDFEFDGERLVVNGSLPKSNPSESLEKRVYDALVLGLRDYVNKNGFPGVILGLSGGIDSGLSVAIAVDALGADRVQAVMMPFRYTSSMSIEDAEDQAQRLGINYRCLPIEGLYESYLSVLAEPFEGIAADKTEENLQARCRGTLLMALSNKFGHMVLTTGNKSEMAVGYATLYGDMVGGYNALKDVPKTLVFKLAEYRNTLPDGPVIPQRVIDRPPSAELAPDQVDEDSLPPYSILDQILALYVEQDCSADDIVAQGFAHEDVYHIVRLVDLNQYKRDQAPIGVRITRRGFGKDRRYPITCRWQAGE